MEESTISLVVAIIALLVALLTFFQLKSQKKPNTTVHNTVPLQLQAYERLVMLCERISIPTLISRTNQPQLSAKEMQVILLENIKQEFEYNSSQQIYVSQAAWDAVRNLRDQNMLIINQVASSMPESAKAGDLNRQLLDVIVNQKENALHIIVLQALNFEAKKLMN
jgi:hypothetical protein